MASAPHAVQQEKALPKRSYREFVRAFRQLDIDRKAPVIVHSSLSAFNPVLGGPTAVVGALMDRFETLLMPTFTYKTMIFPESGPKNNGIEYGMHKDHNKMVEFYSPELSADPLMGIIPETFRQLPDASRSGHPILSFAGVNARKYINEQRLDEPFAPIAAMTDAGGWVLLLGVTHRVNTSIHLGERLAGRKTFVRWAAMTDMVVECPNFPSCSDGFDAIQPLIAPFTRKVTLGDALIRAIPLHELVETVRQLLDTDPLSLLCDDTFCPRCIAVRRSDGKTKI